MTVQSQVLPLPKSRTRLSNFVVELLRLKQLQRVVFTPRDITVERRVERDQPVVPISLEARLREEPALGLDLAHILHTVAVETVPYDPAAHPLHVLMSLFDRAVSRQAVLAGFVALEGDGLPAALGLPPGARPAQLFGVPITYATEGLEPSFLLALLSDTGDVADVSVAVLLDLGEEA